MAVAVAVAVACTGGDRAPRSGGWTALCGELAAATPLQQIVTLCAVATARASRRFVTMRMMQVRHMRMAVTGWLVLMRMAVRPNGHQVMHMVMVAIVVDVCVFVCQGFMLMLVGMRLGEMDQNADQHQAATKRQAPTA